MRHHWEFCYTFRQWLFGFRFGWSGDLEINIGPMSFDRVRSFFPEIGDVVLLQNVPPGIIDRLPIDDQIAIRHAIGGPVEFLGFGFGKYEVEFKDAQGDYHSIWVPARCVAKIEHCGYFFHLARNILMEITEKECMKNNDWRNWYESVRYQMYLPDPDRNSDITPVLVILFVIIVVVIASL